MSSSIPIQIAETIQTASIKRNPDVAHDLNPSTAASSKQPVTVSPNAPSSDSSHEVDTFDEVNGIDEEEEDIPYDVIRPLPRRPSLPPLPDLRFEQSYQASIAGADTFSKVAYITIRDQVGASSIATGKGVYGNGLTIITSRFYCLLFKGLYTL
jgi:Autophagy receptor ATG43